MLQQEKQMKQNKQPRSDHTRDNHWGKMKHGEEPMFKSSKHRPKRASAVISFVKLSMCMSLRYCVCVVAIFRRVHRTVALGFKHCVTIRIRFRNLLLQLVQLLHLLLGCNIYICVQFILQYKIAHSKLLVQTETIHTLISMYKI